MKITNDGDKPGTLVTRDLRSGLDSETITLEAGESATIELEDGYQLVISPPPREPGELAGSAIPVARKNGATDATDEEGDQLREGTDDEVRSEIADMVSSQTDLTKSGEPNVEALNARLEAKGLAPVNSVRRSELMPAPTA
jgi:hypothetical protein